MYHLPRSATNIHSDQARSDILSTRFPSDDGPPLPPTRCIVLDQGSRPGPALVPGIETLLIDHHLSDSFPSGPITVLSACHSLPVATTSLLVYELSSTLVPSLRGSGPTGLAALIGAYGDLGAGKLKFGGGGGGDDEPWPASLAPIEKQLTKSALSKAVALLNAPRRTPEFKVADAYSALVAAAASAAAAAQGDQLSSRALKGILDDNNLIEAKERTSAETARWQAAPPVFTKDGKIAVVTIDSGYQSESLLLSLKRSISLASP